MDLYFSPLACSLATRIALYESGGEANFLEVDAKSFKEVAHSKERALVVPHNRRAAEWWRRQILKMRLPAIKFAG